MESCYTITEYIDSVKNKEVSMQSLYLKEMLGKNTDDIRLIVNNTSILDKYRRELYADTRLITFSNTEKLKYYYKPWLYCYDKYDTSELWFELLKLNQLSSFTQFDRQTIRIFNPSIKSKILSILDLERDLININTNEINTLKKEAAST